MTTTLSETPDDLVIEEVVRTELVEMPGDQCLLIEQVDGDLVIELEPQVVLEETESLQVIEVAAQGPPGPRGPQGIQGPSGVSTIGGYDVVIADPQPGDLMALNTELAWANDKVVDGGNF